MRHHEGYASITLPIKTWQWVGTTLRHLSDHEPPTHASGVYTSEEAIRFHKAETIARKIIDATYAEIEGLK